MTAFLARRERFDAVGSTNDVVRGWLADGTPEVSLAVADEQTAGRGRQGRSWVAPPGAALLLSLGFRPAWLAAASVWRLAACVSLAMAEAAESVAGLPEGTIGLKWPNDLVVGSGGEMRKVAGVLGETDGLGSDDPRVVVGLGINADWRAADFPAELASTMSSLREASGGRPIDRGRLLDAFVERLEPGVEALRRGSFDAASWTRRQSMTGQTARLERADRAETVRVLGVDTVSGALVIEDRAALDGQRTVVVGEIGHLRPVEPIAGSV
jgi:BirA family biotin operon repressor/biotin-[acetyl-CoA-carboxylase] ligase